MRNWALMALARPSLFGAVGRYAGLHFTAVAGIEVLHPSKYFYGESFEVTPLELRWKTSSKALLSIWHKN